MNSEIIDLLTEIKERAEQLEALKRRLTALESRRRNITTPTPLPPKAHDPNYLRDAGF